MAQRMPLPVTVSCFSKIQMVLPFWYRLTRVVPEKGPLNGCVCVIVAILYDHVIMYVGLFGHSAVVFHVFFMFY